MKTLIFNFYTGGRNHFLIPHLVAFVILILAAVSILQWNYHYEFYIEICVMSFIPIRDQGEEKYETKLGDRFDNLITKLILSRDNPKERPEFTILSMEEDLRELENLPDPLLLKALQDLVNHLRLIWKVGKIPSSVPEYMNKLINLKKKCSSYYKYGPKGFEDFITGMYIDIGFPGIIGKYKIIEARDGPVWQYLALMGADENLTTYIDKYGDVRDEREEYLGKATEEMIKIRKSIHWQWLATVNRYAKGENLLRVVKSLPLEDRREKAVKDLQDSLNLINPKGREFWDPYLQSFLISLSDSISKMKEYVSKRGSALEASLTNYRLDPLKVKELLLARDKLLFPGKNCVIRDGKVEDIKDQVIEIVDFGAGDALALVFSKEEFRYIYLPKDKIETQGLIVITLVKPGVIVHHLPDFSRNARLELGIAVNSIPETKDSVQDPMDLKYREIIQSITRRKSDSTLNNQGWKLKIK